MIISNNCYYLRLTLKDNDTCLCACCMGNYSIKTIGAIVLSDLVINICNLITKIKKVIIHSRCSENQYRINAVQCV